LLISCPKKPPNLDSKTCVVRSDVTGVNSPTLSLQESLDLWSDCVNSKWLANGAVILFLNKFDLFKKKFLEEKIPLNDSGLFPDAPEGFDEETAVEWFKQKFLSRMKANSDKVIVHLLTATDSEDVKKVFRQCRKVIAATLQ
jgi:hypothetical protein